VKISTRAAKAAVGSAKELVGDAASVAKDAAVGIDAAADRAAAIVDDAADRAGISFGRAMAKTFVVVCAGTMFCCGIAGCYRPKRRKVRIM
jgi:hypothetical protein